MNKEEIKEIVEDFAERRIESAIQTFNALFLDHKIKMEEVVEKQINKSVNGKIDKIANHLEKQDKAMEKHNESMEKISSKVDEISSKVDELQPVNTGVKIFRGVREFIVWATPIGILGALYNWFKN
jgi:uncharacterized protein YaaN involved in tellurite resistance